MAIRPIRDELRCKICRSSDRAAIDALLEQRSRAIKAEDGSTVTLATVLEAMASFGIDNPTKENVTVHFKKHCQLIDNDAAEAIADAVDATLAQLVEGERLDPDAALDRIVLLGMAEIEAKVAAGQRAGIPPDLVLKAIQVKTQRRSSEAQSDLLRAVGGGIAQALAARGQAALPAADADELLAEPGEFEEIEA